MHENENTIILLDEEGNEVEFELVMTMESEGKEYTLLKYMDDDSDDMFAFRIDTDEEGDVLIPLEDEEEIQRVQEIYDEIISQE